MSLRRAASREAVDAAALPSWYGALREHTAPTRFVPLGAALVEFLLEDGLGLPPGWGSGVLRSGLPPLEGSGETGGEGEEEVVADDQPRFVEERDAIAAAIAALGGRAFVKLNWSAPRDAAWLTGSLQAASAGEALSLVRSSDFCLHDLEHAYGPGQGLAPGAAVLCLRRWAPPQPSGEFRVFVGPDARVLAASQRDTCTFYAHLAADAPALRQRLAAAAALAAAALPPPLPADGFALDVYLDGRGRARVVDVNVLDEVTDSLLFDWGEELWPLAYSDSLALGEWELRLVADEDRVQPNPLAQYRAPTDVINNLASLEAVLVGQYAESSSSESDADDGGEEEEGGEGKESHC